MQILLLIISALGISISIVILGEISKIYICKKYNFKLPLI